MYSHGTQNCTRDLKKASSGHGGLLNLDFSSHPIRLSSYLLYFIKMSFHHFNYSKKTMVILHQRGLHPAHISKLAKEWLDQQNILTMKWPAYSPDLNPIEHVWAWIKAFCIRRKVTSQVI